MKPSEVDESSQTYQYVSVPPKADSEGFRWLSGEFFTALQSASYIIVLTGSFLIWQSKKWFRGLIEKHFSMIETLQRESRANLELTAQQHETIAQLTDSNEVLSKIVARNVRRLQDVQEQIHANTEALDVLAVEAIVKKMAEEND